jgi:hypothetical protein
MDEILKIAAEARAVRLELYCLTIAGLASFLQECYKPAMILQKYKAFLLKSWDERPRKILKPLGLCIYCQLFWLNTIAYPFYFKGYDLNYILTIGGTFAAVELIRLIQNGSAKG